MTAVSMDDFISQQETQRQEVSLPLGHELWLGKSAPRYTSYPPALFFHDSVTVEQYCAALSSIPANDPVSLYLHIPYCKKQCLYCACNTQVTHSHEVIDDYLHTMDRELINLANASPEQYKLSKLHFGGGSPNLMSEKDMGLLMDKMLRLFNFGAVTEISMELDPRLVTVAQCKVLKMVGVNRVSLGVQDFDPDVQKAIGRVQSYAQVARAVFDLREAGIKHINVDLMYGLPRQTEESMEDTAILAETLKPDRISLFSYAHVPQVKKHQQALEKHGLPSLIESLALEKAARGVFLEAGYEAIGMDHFALPTDSLTQAMHEDRLHRTFQGYTDDQAAHLLGVGASSISQTGDHFFQNVRDVQEYRQRVRQSGFATVCGLRKQGDDHLRGAIIEKLMCNMEADVEEICHHYGYELDQVKNNLLQLAPFEMAGVIERYGYKIKLGTGHRMAMRVVASLFDRYKRSDSAPVSCVV